MRNFLLYVLKILFLILALAIIIDKAYSCIFLQSNQRDKIGYIYNSEPKQYDVVILGSSRANNHFVTQMFTDKGLKTFNFGMQGSKLFESDLVLKLLLEKKNKIKNVIIDVDVTLKSETRSEGTFVHFLPYLHSSDVVKKQFEDLDDFKSLYYIPFYRYLKYDTKIGFREMFFYGLNKRSQELNNGGYDPLTSNGTKLNEESLNFQPKRNRYYEEIKRICKLNHINLIAVMTPMCENVIGIDYFQKANQLYPEIHNYENVVVEDQYFSSCGHMNDNGSKIFTARILKDFFNK
ncbi:hypothetical protein B0A79_13645 [Flavobacterium piscis]|uniref:SGNH/GDSL hydrolase family protein n=1 Tax=Flavobacterium piscis TaxID=1114874 RepID=A0ABX2XEM1_9FLAO|nr:hypothetical protein [Flavobacterium piscis]OCB70600.1 hypothetical protein FLP_18155 [Flavobacterium piscis]OXG03726.1 hypothetical protein B0A79_13645 [Flavobacterium piscis]